MGLKTQRLRRRKRVRQEAPELGGLRFAIDFAGRDLTALTATELDSIWRDVALALDQPVSDGFPFTAVPRGRAAWDAHRTHQLLDAQTGVRAMFEGWLSGSPAGVKVALATTGTPSVEVRPGHVALAGSLRCIFLFELAKALGGAHGSKVKRCPACTTPFVQVTRKQYCSTRCQSRMYMRTYRKDSRHATQTRQRGRERSVTSRRAVGRAD